eukprot:510727-Alexandrium_andersonii.AAC.1
MVPFGLLLFSLLGLPRCLLASIALALSLPPGLVSQLPPDACLRFGRHPPPRARGPGSGGAARCGLVRGGC